MRMSKYWLSFKYIVHYIIVHFQYPNKASLNLIAQEEYTIIIGENLL